MKATKYLPQILLPTLRFTWQWAWKFLPSGIGRRVLRQLSMCQRNLHF